MKADGSEARYIPFGGNTRLTRSPRPDILPPAWSPNGQRIAFTAFGGRPRPDSPRAVYTVRPDGSGLTRISDALSKPAWSPDGKHLAFARQWDDRVSLFIAGSAHGENLRMLTTITDLRTYSYPYGRYVGNHINPYSILYRYGDAVPRMHTLSWSPDGNHIMYTCDSGVCIVDLDGNLVGWTPFGPVGDWSPSGERIAVRATVDLSYENGMELVYTMDIDGSNIHILVF